VTTVRSKYALAFFACTAVGCGDNGESDTDPPAVSVTLPSTDRLHDLVPVTAVAQDNDGVAGVQLVADGGALGAEDTEAPFLFLWDTRLHANGIHQLSAVARDFAGNTTAASPVQVSVSNPKPLPDRIVLASDGPDNGLPDIYAVDGNGTGLTRLTFTDDLSEFDPAVSPDGQRIAFTRQLTDGNFEIFVMNADGSGETNLTNDPATDLRPDWSPDGSRIAFNSNRGAGGQIYIMNSDGSAPAPVTSVTGGAADEAAWSPDGSLIALTHSTDIGQTGIAVVRADGTAFQDLTPPAADNGPSWSPDGTEIAFNRYDEVSVSHIHLMDADGGNIRGIFTAADTADSYPVWSRDGSQLIFERNASVETNRDIWVMNLDGGGAFKVVTLPGSDISPDVSP
jgi:Tol biopolymer transport system component